MQIYGYKTWKGTRGYNTSVRSPLEANKANILAQFCSGVTSLLIPFSAICAVVFLHGKFLPAEQAAARGVFEGIGDAQTAKQMVTPVALAQVVFHDRWNHGLLQRVGLPSTIL